MGCGSSSLKGEAQTGTADDAPQPIKKVQTNFSTVDYDADATKRRDTVYAPHDIISQKSEAPSALSPLTEKKTDPLESNNIDGIVGNSTHQETATSGSRAFENRISEQPNTSLAIAPEDAVNKAPYHDVTVSPIAPQTVEEQLPLTTHTQAERPAQ